MKTRTKYFLGAIPVSIVVASVLAGDPSILLRAGLSFGILFGLTWLAWRGFVFLRLLFAPVRAQLKPYSDPINNHLDDTLRRSGLGKLADLGNALNSRVEGAVKATQDGLDARHK